MKYLQKFEAYKPKPETILKRTKKLVADLHNNFNFHKLDDEEMDDLEKKYKDDLDDSVSGDLLVSNPDAPEDSEMIYYIKKLGGKEYLFFESPYDGYEVYDPSRENEENTKVKTKKKAEPKKEPKKVEKEPKKDEPKKASKKSSTFTKEDESIFNKYLDDRSHWKGRFEIFYHAELTKDGDLYVHVTAEGKKGYVKDAEILASKTSPDLPKGYSVDSSALLPNGKPATKENIDIYDDGEYQQSEFSGRVKYKIKKT